MNIGQRIKILREARALSQRELASRAGFSNEALRRWEDGTHEPMARSIRAVAAALEVSISEVIGEAINQPSDWSRDLPAPAPQAVQP